MKTKKTLALKASLVLSIPLTLIACGGGSSNSSAPEPFAKPTSFSGFPVTIEGAEAETSVSYTGQMARHTLRESLKSILSSDTYTKEQAMEYFANADDVVDSESILAPSNNAEFIFKETSYGEISSGKNLVGKAYNVDGNGDPISGGNADGTVMGFPGNLSPAEFTEWVLDRRALITSKTDLDAGYDYQQLLSKYLIGAVFYNQAVDQYLDENLTADVKPNNEPYSPGKVYSGKEHSWDEGFGYFGAAAHFGELTPSQNYEINKKGKDLPPAEVLALADKDQDGMVSMYTEYNYASAYYASIFDRVDGSPSTYGADIMDAFLEGRTLIANAVDNDGIARALTDAERTSLTAYAATIKSNWEMVLAEAVYRYAGISHGDITDLESGTETSPSDYYKHWGEMKGFMLSLQYGGANSIINAANFTEIDNLIGYGPVLQNGNQVNGIDANAAPTFSTGNTLTAYKTNLKMIQEKLDALYSLKAKQNTL